MTCKKTYIVAVLLVAVCVAISACSSAVRHTQTVNPGIGKHHVGPPPHAPAHGYRHRHRDGVELQFDSKIGVYVVLGYAEHYYYKDKYYRLDGGSWEVSVNVNKGWVAVPEKKLPPGLRNKHVCKKK